MQWRNGGSPRPKLFQVQKPVGEVLASIFWEHREEETTMVWPRQKYARGENTKINYGMDTTGERKK